LIPHKVRTIGVNRLHHRFVNQNVKVVGAE
jgi:hypothetical protein